MSTAFQTCYRHSDQSAGVICQRCDRPICPQCMRQAAVGFHCPECAKSGRQEVHTVRSIQRMNQPIAAYTLIAINVAVFLIGSASSGGLNVFNLHYGLFVEGVIRQNGPVVGVAHGQWWRVITAGFMHENLFHIASNMFSLWILGMLCERMVGRWRFVLVYAVALIAGSLGALIVSPDVVTVGASGAIFGLFGLLIVGARANGINLRQTGLITWLVLDLVFTFTIPGISVGGHIGGLLGGALAAVAVIEVPRRLRNASPSLRNGIGAALAAGIGVACFVAALAVAANHAV